MLYLIAGAVAVYALYHLFADTQDDRPQSRSLSRASSPVRRRRERQPERNVDASNTLQESYRPVDDYESLRARAKKEGDLMAQCYQQSKDAYERRDRARAKSLSDEGKRHALKMESLNTKASALIFQENNQDKPTCEVDLHGLYVKEAISYSEMALAKARRRGDSEIRFIVGQGNHSDGGISRLKPAIQEAMRSRGVRVEVDSKNPGVLLALLDG